MISKLTDSNLNVCILNDSFQPQIDGVVNVITNYADNIENNTNGKACVVAPFFPNAVDDYSYDVYRYKSFDLGPKFGGYRVGWPYFASCVDKVANWNPDIIHTHCPFASAIMARNIRHKIDAPIIFTYHTKFDIDIDKNMKTRFMQKSSRRTIVRNVTACDEVWAVSKGAGENLKSLGYKGDYIVMENGVDFPCSRIDDFKLEKLRYNFQLNISVPTFIFVGRLMWYKGIKIILDGLKIVKESGQSFKMIFVGDGTDGDEIRNYAKKIGISEECIFVGVVADRESLKEWYCVSDFLLFPSTFDTNGLVVREAAACSIGALLIKGSCAAEGVKDQVNGVLIDKSSDEMARRIIELCKRPYLFRSIGEAAANDLYISWHDAVAKACDRYKVVYDNYFRIKSTKSKYINV